MYLIVAFAVTVLVITLAWRGVGVTRQPGDDGGGHMRLPERPPRPTRPAPRRFIAPDDDPEFLSEIDRRLRGEGKNN
ncbi:MAG: hypothetical protein ABI382_08595 [Nakamurella sp.]